MISDIVLVLIAFLVDPYGDTESSVASALLSRRNQTFNLMATNMRIPREKWLSVPCDDEGIQKG